MLRPGRLRQVPAQFSWVDQALVQRHFIDRCDARAAALYLFLITVCDAQGMSYYGAATLAPRLRLSPQELVFARTQLIELELIAYQAPLYQVLALPGTVPRTSPRMPAPAAIPAPQRGDSGGPVILAELLEQVRRRHA